MAKDMIIQKAKWNYLKKIYQFEASHFFGFFPIMKPKMKENKGYIEKNIPIIDSFRPRSSAPFGKNIAGIPKVQ